MLRFRDYSIPRKLTWMNMLVSGTALTLACASFIAYDLISFRKTMDRNLSIQAQIVGTNSASALLFDDPHAAEKTLSALEAAPNIVSAAIYAPDGHPFASYWHNHGSQPAPLPASPPPQTQMHWFKDRQIALVRPIIFQGNLIGTVYIRSDLQELIDRLQRYAIIVTAVLSISLLAALLTSSVVRRSIADPIVSLAETARIISRERIYSVRASATGNRDELAILIGTFNEMLAQIQERDTALQSEIAGRRHAQEELHESQARLAGIIASATDAIVAVDEQQRVVLFNAAAERMFRCPAAQALEQSIEFFIPQRFRSQHAAHIQRFGEAGVTNRAMGSLDALWAVRTDGEEFQIEASISQVVSDGKKLFTVILRDVTERKQGEDRLASQAEELSRQAAELARTEQELRKLNDELEHRVAERTAELEATNQDLEAFTYSVSHDLRAPLRHMNGFTRILVEDFGSLLPAEAQRHLERIENGAQRMGLLVDELLNLTRVGRKSLAVQVAGLGSIVKDVISLLAPEIDGRQVQWQIAELPFVECDPTLMRQVFQNLISNALKYSRPRPLSVIEIGQVEKDGIPAIFVKDNGVGFSMKYADKLFGVFQRLHRPEDFEGTGVGLATVHRIIQKHGGRVWAEAELDRGATFYFTLGGREHPVAGNAAAAAGGH
jgi:PAS domain S-box-containing protein